jgi:hypothetical protein
MADATREASPDADWEYWDDGVALTDFWQEVVEDKDANEDPVEAWMR